MTTSAWVRRSWLAAICAVTSCASAPESSIEAASQALSPSARRTRAALIRDAAAARGITQGWMLAGIADAETGMSQCWSELTWACMGPVSDDCGGGPVVAGAGDGACSLMQGGLGMFQFDAGDFDDTLEREGDRILSISGNVDAAVDFVISMVKRSTYISDVDTDAQALAWINNVRTDNEHFETWIKTVTHYYNGCVPGSCSVYTARHDSYSSHATSVYEEMGASFWTTNTSAPDAGVSVQDASVIAPQDAQVEAEPDAATAEQADGSVIIGKPPSDNCSVTPGVRSSGLSAWGVSAIALVLCKRRRKALISKAIA